MFWPFAFSLTTLGIHPRLFLLVILNRPFLHGAESFPVAAADVDLDCARKTATLSLTNLASFNQISQEERGEPKKRARKLWQYRPKFP